MKQQRRGSCLSPFIWLIVLLGAGVAIPKLTVHDSAPVSSDLRACAQAAAAQEYDKPYERVALMLGQSRVTSSSTSVAEIEPYTLFRVPLSYLRGHLQAKMSVTCDAVSTVAGASKGCDVGALCLQQGPADSGLFGIAKVEAYLIGKKTFDDPAKKGSKVACYVMRITSTNDQRVIGELGSNDFVVPEEAAKRFDAIIDPKATASLLIYIKERAASGAGPCDQRVQILN